MYVWARPHTDVNSPLIPVEGCWFTPAKTLQGWFSFWHVPSSSLRENLLLLHETNFLFSIQLFHFSGEITPVCYTSAHSCTRITPSLELGKASVKPLVSHDRNLLYHRLKLFMGDVYRQFWKTGLGVIFSWCPGVSGEAASASGKQFLPWRCWR